MADRTYSPQEAAWRGLYKEYGGDGLIMDRHANKDGSLRITITRSDQYDPVCKATISPEGRVVTDLMDPVI